MMWGDYLQPPDHWPLSKVTGLRRKLVIPVIKPHRKFALIIGDSCLSGFIDGVVKMPKGPFDFGFWGVFGAGAIDMLNEVVYTIVPRLPDVVVIVAPSTNLTISRNISEAAKDFALLLGVCCNRWPSVCVLDFPPRLNVDVSYQDSMRHAFFSTATNLGVRYFPANEFFPYQRTDLWASDRVHLSDSEGMPILAALLNVAASEQHQAPKLESHIYPGKPAWLPDVALSPQKQAPMTGKIKAPLPHPTCGPDIKKNAPVNGVLTNGTAKTQVSDEKIDECE